MRVGAWPEGGGVMRESMGLMTCDMWGTGVIIASYVATRGACGPYLMMLSLTIFLTSPTAHSLMIPAPE